MTTSFPASHFFYDSVVISREHLKQSTFQGNCVYFIALLATIHYNKRSVVDSRKIEEYVYLRKTIACSFKGANLFHRTSYNNASLKSNVLNAQKHLQRSHSFMVNQYSDITFMFSNILKHSTVSKCIVNFLEEQLQTFPLAGVTFGTVTFC